MRSAQECLDEAVRYEQIAATVSREEEREALLTAAAQWRKLAISTPLIEIAAKAFKPRE